jgi:hypothetical protein
MSSVDSTDKSNVAVAESGHKACQKKVYQYFFYRFVVAFAALRRTKLIPSCFRWSRRSPGQAEIKAKKSEVKETPLGMTDISVFMYFLCISSDRVGRPEFRKPTTKSRVGK